MSFYVFDLDGTLCNITHRVHLVRNGNNKWDEFFDSCDEDEPENEIIYLLQDLCAQGHRVEIWSGRSASAEDKTFAWLDEHIGEVWSVGDGDFIPASNLLKHMRPVGDFQSDVELKRNWLHLEDKMPDVIFDDRRRVVDMWREEGIKCCQVEPGDFDDDKSFKRPRKPTLTLMVGPSGAGKSTFLRENKTTTPIISSDTIREEQFKHENDFKAVAYSPDGFSSTFGAVHSITRAHLDSGLDVIVDSTNLNRKNRLSLLKAVGADSGDVFVNYIVIDRPLDEKLESYRDEWHTNEDIIRKHHQTFQSSIDYVLNGDGLPFVNVLDYRSGVIS